MSRVASRTAVHSGPAGTGRTAVHPELAGTGQTPLAPAQCPHALGARPYRWETYCHFAVLGHLSRYGEKRARVTWGFSLRAEPLGPLYRLGAFETAKYRHHFLNDAQRRCANGNGPPGGGQPAESRSRQWPSASNPRPHCARQCHAATNGKLKPHITRVQTATKGWHAGRGRYAAEGGTRQRVARRQRAFLKKVSGEISFSETPFV